MKRRLLYLAILLLLAAPQGCGEAEQGTRQELGTLTVAVPEGWEVQTPTSAMRKAQYGLPRQGSDGEDALLVVYHFGSDQGGSVDANLKRWYGQIRQPDGKSTADLAQVSTKQVSGMPVTVVDVTGTYAPSAMGPMVPATPPKDGYRMVAAIVTTGEGDYYFKLTGPEHTVAYWQDSFHRFVDSIE